MVATHSFLLRTRGYFTACRFNLPQNLYRSRFVDDCLINLVVPCLQLCLPVAAEVKEGCRQNQRHKSECYFCELTRVAANIQSEIIAWRDGQQPRQQGAGKDDEACLAPASGLEVGAENTYGQQVGGDNGEPREIVKPALYAAVTVLDTVE